MIWAKEETLSRADIETIQLERLQETVRRVYGKVPAYRKKMEEAGIVPEDIRSLEDLQRLPFTTKQDMRDNYPFGLLRYPKRTSAEFMLPAVLLGNLRLWDIPGGIWIYGPNVWQGSHAWEEPPAGILHRFVLDMACLQAPWACITDWRR